MVDDVSAEAILAQARAAQAGTPLSSAEIEVQYRRLHDLAAERSAPARTFFESLLAHLDAEWRLIAVQCLSHYELADSPGLLDRMRQMLANDPDGHVRIWLAGILGRRYNQVRAWPEEALINVLDNDPNLSVRANAFRGLLDNAPIPYATAQEAMSALDREEFPPTWEEVERIVAAAQGDMQGCV